jgi:hypothetical protein
MLTGTSMHRLEKNVNIGSTKQWVELRADERRPCTDVSLSPEGQDRVPSALRAGDLDDMLPQITRISGMSKPTVYYAAISHHMIQGWVIFASGHLAGSL